MVEQEPSLREYTLPPLRCLTGRHRQKTAWRISNQRIEDTRFITHRFAEHCTIHIPDIDRIFMHGTSTKRWKEKWGLRPSNWFSQRGSVYRRLGGYPTPA